MSVRVPATSAPTVNSPAGVRPGRGQAVAGLLVAAAIVAFAWWIGGRAGWDAIGQGGINQRLLPKVGEAAPDFRTEDVFGNPIRLSDYAGRPVWLSIPISNVHFLHRGQVVKQDCPRTC